MASSQTGSWPWQGTKATVTRMLGVVEAHSGQVALAAVALNLVATLSFAIVLGDQLRYLDERDYVALTGSMAQGNGFSGSAGPTAYRPPGYPLLLLPVYLLSNGSILAMRMVGVLALSGTIWLVYVLGRRAHSGVAGVLAALLMAGYPLLGYTATALYPQVPALFLLLLFLEASMRLAEPQPPHRWWTTALVGGLAGGLLTITVPTFGPSVVTVLAWLAWRHRLGEGRRRALRTLAVCLLAAAVLPTVWCVRNAVQLHAFVPLSTNTGVNLLLGNSERVTASSGPGGDISTYRLRAERLDLDEVELDHFYRDEALDWMIANPMPAGELYLQKVAHNFSFRDDLATAGQSSAVQDLVSALAYYPLLGLALLRVLTLRRWPLGTVERATLWLLVGNMLLLALFFTRLRLRVPLDGLMILLAATAAAHLLQRWSSIAERQSPT